MFKTVENIAICSRIRPLLQYVSMAFIGSNCEEQQREGESWFGVRVSELRLAAAAAAAK